MASLKSFLKYIDIISEWSGKCVAFIIWPAIVIVVWEVVSRYVFNHPTIWAHGISQRIFAFYYILSGAYVTYHNAHVNVDMISTRFPAKIRVIVCLIAFLCLLAFCGVMLWKGIDFAWTSVRQLEPDETPWRAPLYPVKLIVPVGAFLILIQGFASFIRDLIAAIHESKCEH